MHQESLMWQAPESIKKEKGSDWYWALGIISVSLVIIAVLYKNFIFAIFIVLSSVILVIVSRKEPDVVECEIGHRGVRVDKTVYLYDSLESYWIDEDHIHTPKVLIKSKKVLMPFIALPLGEMDANYVREYLAMYLKEEELREPLSQKIMEYLGF